MREINLLVQDANEKTSLLDVEDSIGTTELRYAPLAYLEAKMNYLISQI